VCLADQKSRSINRSRRRIQYNPFEGAITHRKMLSIERCKEILKKYNYNLSNEEIKQVREVLYLFAEIQINAEKQLLEDEKCDIILQS